MNFKRNALGLLAAGALSLGMISGAMAADTTVTATLGDANGTCTLSSVSATTFGNYTFNGTDTFVADQSAGRSTVSGTVSVEGMFNSDNFNGTCNLSISGGNLTADSGNSVINVDNISVEGGSTLSGTAQSVGSGTGSVSATLNMDDFPSNGITVLNQHSGTITFNVTTAD